jgi:hypothetical protein
LKHGIDDTDCESSDSKGTSTKLLLLQQIVSCNHLKMLQIICMEALVPVGMKGKSK